MQIEVCNEFLTHDLRETSLSHMKTATVRELRNEFPKLASYLEDGEEILLTRRSKPIAKILPIEEGVKEVVDWSKSAAFQMKRSSPALTEVEVQKILDDSKGDF